MTGEGQRAEILTLYQMTPFSFCQEALQSEIELSNTKIPKKRKINPMIRCHMHIVNLKNFSDIVDVHTMETLLHVSCDWCLLLLSHKTGTDCLVLCGRCPFLPSQ